MLNDLGVQPESVRSFYDADSFTRENLFYITRWGAYSCDGTYQFARKSSEVRTCQIILVEEGALELHYKEKEYLITPNHMILMHLGEPHLYRTSGDYVKILWAHIEGQACLPYIHLIEEAHGICLDGRRFVVAVELFRRIIEEMQAGRDNSHDRSVRIHRLFALIAGYVEEQRETDLEKSLRISAEYMKTHYEDQGLSVSELAGHAAMSVSYYLRSFKARYGKTPHRYLLDARLHAARGLLDTTSLSIEEVAGRCGFCSASHLIAVFRRETGMTPLQFRNLWR